MAAAAHDGGAQLCLCCLYPQLTQQLYPLGYLQAADMILLHTGRRILAGSPWPEPTGEQHPAATWLAIERVDPLPNTWPFRKRLPCSTIEQVLKLIQNEQPCPVYRIQCIEKCGGLILQRQTAQIRHGFVQGCKKRSGQVGQSDRRINGKPKRFNSKQLLASTTLLLRIAIDQRSQRRFANATNTRQYNGCHIGLGQLCVYFPDNFLTLLDGSGIGRWRGSYDAARRRFFWRSGWWRRWRWRLKDWHLYD